MSEKYIMNFSYLLFIQSYIPRINLYLNTLSISIILVSFLLFLLDKMPAQEKDISIFVCYVQ
jgi:hypothetical protein